jgi:hypothetical protein
VRFKGNPIQTKTLPSSVQHPSEQKKNDSTDHAGKNSRGNPKELFTVKKG